MNIQTKTCKKIIEALKDPSFPSIVLVNGPWGSGKTFLVKNFLQQEIKKEHPSNAKAHYLSLYGIKDLEDFKSKIISQVQMNNPKAARVLNSTVKVIGSIAKGVGDKGATNGVINALADPIKHHLMSKLNNVSLIVDDLERISDKSLKEQVLGECLNLAENNTNVWIVVVANDKYLDDCTALLEKTFLNKITLETNADSVIEFIRSQYNNISEYELEIIRNLVRDLELYNYRIIQRIMQRYLLIKGKILQDKRVDKKPALSSVLEKIIRISCAFYQAQCSLQEIRDFLIKSIKDIASMSDEEIKEKLNDSEEKKKNNLEKCFPGESRFINEILLDFCIEFKELPKEFVSILELPLSSSNREKIMSFSINFVDEEDFQSACSETYEYLFKTTEEKDFTEWFRTLNLYIKYIDWGYLEQDKSKIIDLAKIKSKENNFFIKNIFESDYYFTLGQIIDQDIRELHKELEPQIRSNTKTSEIQGLQNALFESWNRVSGKIRRNYASEEFFIEIESKKLVESICDHWDKGEYRSFSGFLAHRYNTENIYNYLANEEIFLNAMKSALDEKINSLSASLLKGSLTELKQGIKLALESFNKSKEVYKKNNV